MRNYIFRGKRKGGKEWLIGDLNRIEGKVYVFERGESAHLHSPDWFEVIPESVGQFTGHLDKNGTRIYEGDIQREEIEFDEGDERIYYVCRWLKEICAFVWMSYGDTCTDWANATEEFPISLQFDEVYTVCGNEFDNPDWWQKD
jgi:uncharacterized phage protein (TIGR01671 family)